MTDDAARDISRPVTERVSQPTGPGGTAATTSQVGPAARRARGPLASALQASCDQASRDERPSAAVSSESLEVDLLYAYVALGIGSVDLRRLSSSSRTANRFSTYRRPLDVGTVPGAGTTQASKGDSASW
jgi:hypothetical protein